MSRMHCLQCMEGVSVVIYVNMRPSYNDSSDRHWKIFQCQSARQKKSLKKAWPGLTLNQVRARARTGHNTCLESECKYVNIQLCLVQSMLGTENNNPIQWWMSKKESEQGNVRQVNARSVFVSFYWCRSLDFCIDRKIMCQTICRCF